MLAPFLSAACMSASRISKKESFDLQWPEFNLMAPSRARWSIGNMRTQSKSQVLKFVRAGCPREFDYASPVRMQLFRHHRRSVIAFGSARPISLHRGGARAGTICNLLSTPRLQGNSAVSTHIRIMESTNLTHCCPATIRTRRVDCE